MYTPFCLSNVANLVLVRVSSRIGQRQHLWEFSFRLNAELPRAYCVYPPHIHPPLL